MTIAVDFDGVIHKYSKGWFSGDIYDEPVENALTSLSILMRKEPVFIHTSRKPWQVANWIEDRSGRGIECTTLLPRRWYGKRKPFWDMMGLLLVTDRKLPARVYIDDRAICFSTWEDALFQLKTKK